MEWLRQGIVDETVKQRYASVGGFTHGFDYLRIILAAAVVLQHSVLSSYGQGALSAIWSSGYRVFFAPVLLMFFGLSGFLVTGSLKKSPTVTSFVTLRAVRLVPALAVEVLLSALVVAPVFTSFGLGHYFTSIRFYTYFLNIIGHVQRDLPGVFLSLPSPAMVNVSIWTIPFELECYLVLIVLYMLGLIKRPHAVLIVTAIAIIIGSISAFARYDPTWAATRPLSRSLVVAFLVGVTLNLFSNKLPLKRSWATLAIAALIAMTIDYRTVYLATVPAVYLCVYAGMMHPPKRGLLFSGDYSYGLYLFAYPIQQTYTSMFPGERVWYLNFVSTLIFGFAYAAFSWWCIEKPILRRKAAIVRAVERLRNKAMRLAGFRPHGASESIAPRVG